MKRIILESKNNNDVLLIKELAKRLNISYKIQSIPESNSIEKNLEHYNKIINIVVDVFNYGNPSQWQVKVREDRSIMPS